MVGEHDCLSMAKGRVVEGGLAEGRRVFGVKCVRMVVGGGGGEARSGGKAVEVGRLLVFDM